MPHIQMAVHDDGDPSNPALRRAKRAANGRGRGSERRRELLEVATRLFYERGYASTTLQDLADEMGFTKAAIYYYAKNKEQLLLEIYEEIVVPATARAQELAAGPGSGGQRFEQLVTEHLRTFLANLEVNAVFDVQSGSLSPEAKHTVQAWGRNYATILRGVYVDGVEDGTLRDLPPSVVVNSILGMCNSIHRWFNPNGSTDIAQVVTSTVSLLACGYQVPEG
ncbi:MAG: TetR/AcrR family transcriptional regulator [Microthrixaceae bacterium]